MGALYQNNTNYSSKDEITIDLLCLVISFFLLLTLVKCFVFISNCRKLKKTNYIDHFGLHYEEEQINFECPICLEIIDDTNVCIIDCKHAYHKECLEKWIQTSVKNRYYKCPLCNIEYLLAK